MGFQRKGPLEIFGASVTAKTVSLHLRIHPVQYHLDVLTPELELDACRFCRDMGSAVTLTKLSVYFSVYWTNFNLVKFVNVVIFKCKCRYQV